MRNLLTIGFTVLLAGVIGAALSHLPESARVVSSYTALI